jgi:uncharacterized repeat protein (TIGR04076 family)
MKSSLLGAVSILGTNQLLNASDKLMPNCQNESNMAAKRHKCKITVLRRELYEDLQAEYFTDSNSGKCNTFLEGQEFIIDDNNYWQMFNGQFCANAWDAIGKYVYAAIQGGSLLRGMTKDERVMIACCNNGTRPVIFKLERMDE